MEKKRSEEEFFQILISRFNSINLREHIAVNMGSQGKFEMRSRSDIYSSTINWSMVMPPPP